MRKKATCVAYVACRLRDVALLARCRGTIVRSVESFFFFFPLRNGACGIDFQNTHVCACASLFYRAFSMGRVHAYIPYALFAQVDRDIRVEAAVSDG